MLGLIKCNSVLIHKNNQETFSTIMLEFMVTYNSSVNTVYNEVVAVVTYHLLFTS